MNTQTYTAPAIWTSALINNDFSGLTQFEAAGVFFWLDREGLSISNFVCCSEEATLQLFERGYTYCLDYQVSMSA